MFTANVQNIHNLTAGKNKILAVFHSWFQYCTCETKNNIQFLWQEKIEMDMLKKTLAKNVTLASSVIFESVKDNKLSDTLQTHELNRYSHLLQKNFYDTRA